MKPEKFSVKVDVDAVQLTEDADWDAIADWCGGRVELHRDPSDEYAPEIVFTNSRGETASAYEGDWIVQGVHGPFAVQPSAFAATYERA